MISFEKEGVLYDYFFKVTLVGTVMSLIFNLILSRLWLAYPAAVINMLPKEIQAQAPKAELKQLCKLRWSLFSFLLFAYSSYWQMFLVNLGELIGLVLSEEILSEAHDFGNGKIVQPGKLKTG